MPDPTPHQTPPKPPIAPPKGTRDLYPEDALRRRYVNQAWRDASIRCGFEEIAGPTFETTDLYSVKSGEGILGELFQAFSGKSPEEVEQVKATGRAPYALRPEFTPTLARMYAAKAGSLPKPCKWFTAGPYFRAERPQRGRLREFEQWNVDVIGLPGEANAEGAEVTKAKAAMDAECVECCHLALQTIGLSRKGNNGLSRKGNKWGEDTVRFHLSDRGVVSDVISKQVSKDSVVAVLDLLDKRDRLAPGEVQKRAHNLGFDLKSFEMTLLELVAILNDGDVVAAGCGSLRHPDFWTDDTGEVTIADLPFDASSIERLCREVWSIGSAEFATIDTNIVRGLAYYTGTVFEVIAEGERAVAGGGRYDKLIELMGGPPTPAVGFAMGDVVLSLLLDDKGLMPAGAELMDAVSRPPASVRPEVFVVGADDEATDPLVRRLAADLRRGLESRRWSESDTRKPWARDRYEPGPSSEGGGVRPLHARISYKSTRNLKKLLADGEKQHARFAAVVHGEDRVQLRDLDARRELTPADVPGMPAGAAEFSVSPGHGAYLGRGVAALLGG